MSIDLTKIKITNKTGLVKDTKILTSDGVELTGVTSILIQRLQMDEMVKVILEIDGVGLDLQAFEAEANVSERLLIEELRARGYKVELDDSDVAKELEQGEPPEKDIE